MYLKKFRDRMTLINPRHRIWATLLSNFERREKHTLDLKGRTILYTDPEKLQTTLKFLELLSLFPRARLIANMNINF